MGERRLCKPEVTGSIPVRSTREEAATDAVSRSLRSEVYVVGPKQSRLGAAWAKHPEVALRRFVPEYFSLQSRHSKYCSP